MGSLLEKRVGRKEAGKARLGSGAVSREADVMHFFITGVFYSDLSEVMKQSINTMVIWIQSVGSSFSTLNFTVERLFIKVIPRSVPVNVRVMSVALFSRLPGLCHTVAGGSYK